MTKKPKPSEGEAGLPADPINKQIAKRISYQPDFGERIFDVMIDGYDLVEACEILKWNRGSVYRWMREHPEFDSWCARAREGLADYKVHEIDQVIRAVTPESAPADRVKLAGLQWRAEKIFPKKYAPKQHTEVTGKDGAPIQMQQHTIIDSASLDADQRDALRAILMAAQGQAEGDTDD
jgi:hypothetical protein